MKLHADNSGQISGQVPNQAESQMPSLDGGMPFLHGRVSRSAIDEDTEFLRARTSIQERIFVMLLQRRQQPINEMQKRRIKDLSKRLEEAVLKSSRSKEEYMDLDTLESRLYNFFRQPNMCHHSNQHPQLVSSSDVKETKDANTDTVSGRVY